MRRQEKDSGLDIELNACCITTIETKRMSKESVWKMRVYEKGLLVTRNTNKDAEEGNGQDNNIGQQADEHKPDEDALQPTDVGLLARIIEDVVTGDDFRRAAVCVGRIKCGADERRGKVVVKGERQLSRPETNEDELGKGERGD